MPLGLAYARPALRARSAPRGLRLTTSRMSPLRVVEVFHLAGALLEERESVGRIHANLNEPPDELPLLHKSLVCATVVLRVLPRDFPDGGATCTGGNSSSMLHAPLAEQRGERWRDELRLGVARRTESLRLRLCASIGPLSAALIFCCFQGSGAAVALRLDIATQRHRASRAARRKMGYGRRLHVESKSGKFTMVKW